MLTNHLFLPKIKAASRGITTFLVIIASFGAFGETAILESSFIRYEVSATGRNVALLDKSDGANLLQPGSDTPMCTLQKNHATWESLSLEVHDGFWHVGFGAADVTVLLRPESHDRYFTLEVVAVRGDGVDQLNFLYLPLGERGKSGPLACTALALNLQTNVPELPGSMTLPMATCYPRFGLAGARVAFAAAPHETLRGILKEIMTATPAIPHSTLGGPWALDAQINRGSYLIDSEGEMGEATVERWIRLAGDLGMKQIDFHTGKSMRFGDLKPNPARYPGGAAGVKTVVTKLHDAGLAAGLHTYAFFIAKDTPWVTPVPDRRLAVAATFTLDADIDAAASTVPVAETTESISTVTGFQIRNSVTLRVDDELIVFGDASRTAPFGFTTCQRGALGTTASAHSKGAAVVQLKECYGLFVPDGDSTLFTEVAARTAEVYNQAGFDMIYLDALDGADILAGGLNSWYYAAKFITELNGRLERPALYEMSTVTHHVWMLRSRLGAWDVPARGSQRLTDIHALANESAARNFMPVNLGWSGIFDWNPIQPERTFDSDVEHLCARALATDSSLSLLVGFTPDTWERSANARRLGSLFKRYETLRLEGGISPSVLARLRESRVPFVVTQAEDGTWQARQRQSLSHTVDNAPVETWPVYSEQPEQAPQIRIECLTDVRPLEHPTTLPLLGGADGATLEVLPAAPGVLSSWECTTDIPNGSAPGLTLKATNQSAPLHASWNGVSKKFAQPLNLYNRGLGFWVKGDGSGAVLNVQLLSTDAASGGRADHYLDLDFSGWRYVTLVEPESARLGSLGWRYARAQVDWGGDVPFIDVLRDYILWVSYDQIAQISLWINGVPAQATTVCSVGPIGAVGLRSAEIKQPTLTLNGTSVTLPVDLQSGDYLELEPDGTGAVYDATGNVKGNFSVGQVPLLHHGENTIGLNQDGVSPARARVTATLFGSPEAENPDDV